MGYKTKPIDYTGCNPIIAEHLKRGEAVLCKCWDDDKNDAVEGYVIAFDGARYPYRLISDWWKNAEPIQTKLYWRKASEIVKWLEENGWPVDINGNWTDVLSKRCFAAIWFHFCGTEACDAQLTGKPSAWFEEK